MDNKEEKPQTAIERAIEFGVDISLNIESLKATPEQRLLALEGNAHTFITLHGAALKGTRKPRASN